MESKVSIIITTHNRVGCLGQAIDSAFMCARNAEVVVVDDASTDGTEAYCRGRGDIKYVRLNKNIKTAGARNAGIEASTAPYIAFLDDDDERIPENTDVQVSLLEKNKNAVLAYGPILQSFGDPEPLAGPVPSVCPQGDVYAELLTENFICLSSTLVRRSALEEVGVFDVSPGMYGIEDWDMWLRLAESGSFCAVSKPVAVYKMPSSNSGQWSSDVTGQFGRVAVAYTDKWLRTERAEALINSGKISKRRLLERVSDRILYDMYVNSSNKTEKLQKLRAALKYYPQNVTRLVFYKTIFRSLVG